jgi:hypothetical protein
MTKARLIQTLTFSAVLGLTLGDCSRPASAQNLIPDALPGRATTILIKGSGSQDQEIELLDRNGRTIKGRLALFLAQQEDSKGAGNGGTGNPPSQRMQAKMLDGQFFVEAEDGSKKAIQPQSVSVSKFNRTLVEDGQETTETVQQTIITDADGNQYEVEMSDNQMIFGLSNLPNATAFSQVAPDRFMIGVQLEPVTDALTAQLNLEPGVGLMISQVTPDSPSAKAGLRIYDILLYAEDSRLRSTDDLTRLVQTAGEAGESISLVLMRGGKEIPAEVLPVLRRGDRLFLPGDPLELEGIPGGTGTDWMIDRLNWQHAGPGIVLDRNIEMDTLLEHLKNLELSAKQRAEQFQNNFRETPDAQNFRMQAQQAVEEMQRRALEIESRSANQAREINELLRNMKLELEELRKLRNRNN